MGIELNANKREPPRNGTRHLGFYINLKEKVISVTQKQRQKIMVFFKRFLKTIRKKGRIAVRDIQRLLGLQI